MIDDILPDRLRKLEQLGSNVIERLLNQNKVKTSESNR